MDIENRNCSQAEGRARHSQVQAKERLMMRICVAERERAAGASRDAFEALTELEARLGLAQRDRHRDLRHVGCWVVADDVVDQGDFALPRYAISLSKVPRRLSTVNAITQMAADRIDPHGEAIPMGNSVSE